VLVKQSNLDRLATFYNHFKPYLSKKAKTVLAKYYPLFAQVISLVGNSSEFHQLVDLLDAGISCEEIPNSEETFVIAMAIFSLLEEDFENIPAEEHIHFKAIEQEEIPQLQKEET
jgi:hypothetical protein